MNYIKETLQNIYEELNTSPELGLSDIQVKKVQEQKGLNKFDEEKKETILQKIFHQLREFTILILLVGTIISFYMALTSADSGFAKPIIIFSIIVISIALAIYQEMGAEKALDALRNMNAPTTVVLRNGTQQPIDASELVPGDILVLSTGDLIPADARLIEAVNLRVEEAILTGESVPVEKNANALVSEKATLGDQFNMLFSGCILSQTVGQLPLLLQLA